MAGTGDHERPVSESENLNQQLAYRYDLEEAIGVIVMPPANHIDNVGRVIWGTTDSTLTGDRQTFDDLSRYLANVADQVLESSAALPPSDRKAPTHTYEIPPAAQSWPQIAVMLWEHGKPYLENSDLVLSLALAIRELVALTHKWFDRKNREIIELNRKDYEAGRFPTHGHVSPAFMLTQGAIVSLVVANLVQRFGYNSDLDIEVFPRGTEGYNDPSHPNGHITYLVRCSFSDQTLVYVVLSSGKVIEHFQVQEQNISPLPTPNLFAPEETYSDTVPGKNGLRLKLDGGCHAQH